MDRSQLPHNFSAAVTAGHKVQGEENKSRLQASLRSRGTGLSFSLDPKLHTEKNYAKKKQEKLTHILTTESKTKFYSNIKLSGTYSCLRRLGQPPYRSMEVPKAQLAGSKKALLLFLFNRVFQKSGGEKRWNALVICEI